MGFDRRLPCLADAVRNGLLPAEAIRPRKQPPRRSASAPASDAPGAVARYEVVLPVPPPLRAVTTNAPGRGRVPTGRYARWRALAAGLLAGAPAVRTPAQVTLCLLPGADMPAGRRWDCCNREKGAVDALVAAGVLPDDDHQYLCRVVCEWEPRADQSGPAMVRLTVETVGLGPEGG